MRILNWKLLGGQDYLRPGIIPLLMISQAAFLHMCSVSLSQKRWGGRSRILYSNRVLPLCPCHDYYFKVFTEKKTGYLFTLFVLLIPFLRASRRLWMPYLEPTYLLPQGPMHLHFGNHKLFPGWWFLDRLSKDQNPEFSPQRAGISTHRYNLLFLPHKQCPEDIPPGLRDWSKGKEKQAWVLRWLVWCVTWLGQKYL